MSVTLTTSALVADDPVIVVEAIVTPLVVSDGGDFSGTDFSSVDFLT